MAMRILFIAWDGPYVNYLEGLFLPIFFGLRKHGYELHVLHFTWADQQVVDSVAESCKKLHIQYRHVRVLTWPHPAIGKYITLLMAPWRAMKFIEEFKIEVIMPRTTMPARVALRVVRRKPNLKLLFDADGLPIEERVDFAGLKIGSLRHYMLKKIERHVIRKASAIITRTDAAINFLIQQYGEDLRSKFHKVINGRDESLFQKTSVEDQRAMRKYLGIPDDAFVSVYCGSLGPQYGVEQMVWLHERMLRDNPNTYWLILTGNLEFFGDSNIPLNAIIKRVLANEVPQYLSIAHVAFALRRSSISMKGVAPVKLGEYLLMGLPVIASADIGDTGKILLDKPFCFVMRDFSEQELEKALKWVSTGALKVDHQDARKLGEQHFGLTNAIESYREALNKLV